MALSSLSTASSTARVAGGYLLFASAWILLSDRILALTLPAELITRFHTIKGLAFVAVTTLLLVVLLKKPPAAEAAVALPERRRPWALTALFASVCVFVVGIGAAGYRKQSAAIIDNVYSGLRATVELKVSGISYWLADCRGDAATFAGNPLVADLVSRWLETGDPDLKTQLLAVLRQQRRAMDIDNLEILDTSGHLLLNDGDDLPDSRGQLDAVRFVTEKHEPTFIDFYRDGNIIRIGFFAPIFSSRNAQRIVGIAMIETRPEKDLFPYLLRISNTGKSGETALLRRDGKDALFLNELRNHPDSALNLRLPLSDPTLVAAQILGGQRGLVRGLDYRGVPVVASAADIPGTHWVLMAKLDEAEAFAGLDQLAVVMGLLFLLVLAVAFALIAYVLQRHRAAAALHDLDQMRALDAAEARFGVTFEEMPLGMAVIARNGRLLRVNQRLSDILDVPVETLVTQSFRDYIHPADLSISHRLRNNALRARFRDETSGQMRYVGHAGKQGWCEITVAAVRAPDGRVEHFIAALQDVSERRQQEEQLRHAAAVFTHTQEGIVITDPKGVILAVNPAVMAITGYSEFELVLQNMSVLRSGRQSVDFYREMWARIQSRGYWQGEIWNRHKNGTLYPEWLTISAIRDEQGQVTNYIATFTDISSEKDFETQIEFMAGHDPLTGLPNRSMLLHQLGTAIPRADGSQRSGALLVLDLDRFKNVNDCLGHPAGDELLIAVCQRIRAELRPTDALFRLGGDEFGVLLEDLVQAEDAAGMARSLIETIARPPFVLTGDREACVGASVGITIFPTDSREPHELLQHADAALYRAKDSGRGTYSYYTQELTQAAVGRLQMESRLRRGIDRREFALFYQPLVNLTDGRIIGAEALIRWQHPTEGLIPPDQFIPLAEQTGLIIPLGDWILREACSQMQAWRLAGLPIDFVAVNLSPRQFHLDDLDRQIAAYLRETGLPAHCLELEITEGALLGEDGVTLGKLDRLKALGVRLSIDDFGTGYSSLAYLRRFPIDKLKIDRSFVKDLPHDAAAVEIAGTIISMGRNLKMDVLAEGVETAEQRDFLRRRDCEFGQGYLFSKPLPVSAFEAFLHSRDVLPSAPPEPLPPLLPMTPGAQPA